MTNTPPPNLKSLSTLAVALIIFVGAAQADIVAWWSFDGTLDDQSGVGNHGAAIGAPTFDANAPFGGAGSLRLNGTDQGVGVAAAASLDSNIMTIAYFINPDGATQSGNFERLTSRGGDVFETSLGAANELSYFSPGPGWLGTGGIVAANDWTHVAWRNSGDGPTDMELFVDGVSVFTGPGVSAGNPTGLLNLGIRHNGTEGFEGLMDDVLLWDDSNNPLTDDDIAEIAADGVAAFLGEDTDIDADGLPNFWETENGLDPDDNGENPNNNGVPGDPDNGADGDPDMDSLTNIEEFEARTDPQDEDSDDDTLTDSEEVALGTDPNKPDTDGDGLDDADEQSRGTDPTDVDSDGDGFTDGFEVAKGTDPLDPNDTPSVEGNLVLHLNFDGTLEDQSGAGNIVAAIGAPVFDVNVPEGFSGGQSIRYNGNDQGVGVLAVPSLDSNESTIAYFINPDGAVQSGGFERLTSRGGDTFETAISGSNELSYFSPGPGWIGTGGIVAENEWAHVAWRNRGSGGTDMDLFINGELVFTGPGISAGNPTGLLNAGIRHNNVEGYEGLMDELRLYSVALSDEEIEELLTGAPVAFNITEIIRADDGSEVSLTWTSRPGRAYSVDFSSDLKFWNEIDDGVPSGGDTTTFVDTLFAPINLDIGYYRVREN